MNKISPITLLLLLVATLCGNSASLSAQNHFSTVVIDPGHGGKDPGAVGKKYKEKNIVLDVSKKLGKMLSDSMPDIKTVFTRETDVFIPLDQRASIANKSNADLFISIHANSSKVKGISGAETFVLGLHRSKENLEVAQKENSVITLEDEYNTKYEGFDPSQPESYIIFELMQNVYLEQSISFASLVQSGFTAAGRADRGVKQAGFLVLRQTSMPSVLVELGFISDATEEAYMASADGSAALVSSIFCAIKKYRQLYDSNNVSIVSPVAPQDSLPKVDLWPESVNFRVQVASSSKNDIKIDTLSFSPLSVFQEDGKFKYMIGLCASADEASALQKNLKDKYPDCFVVAFDGKEKISVKAAKKKLKKDNTSK